MNNSGKNSLLLSGFADECCQSKRIEEQLAAMSGMGLRRYTLRFADLGRGIENAINFTDEELAKLNQLNRDFGLEVASLGSPVGKVKLIEVEDGTSNKFVPFETYLQQDVAKACHIASTLGTKLVRGFSFYHPKGKEPDEYLSQAVDQIGQIAEICGRNGLLYGLEVEANLIGQTGAILQKIHEQVNHDALVLIFDAGNLLTQGYSPDETFAEYEAMKAGLGWIHIKDYRPQQSSTKGGYVDEEALSDYRPVSRGSGVYERVLRDFIENQEQVQSRMAKLGLPGLLLDLEPHVRGGGQFGGYSGADGMGVALRALCDLLKYLGLESDLLQPEDITLD